MALNIDNLFAAEVSDEQGKLSKEAAATVFSDIRDTIAGYTDRDSWYQNELYAVECEWMNARHGTNADAKDRRGNWKMRTFLPIAWSTAKSVCGTAIERGVQVPDGIGKSALEKLNREAVKGKDASKEPWDIWTQQYRNMTNAYTNLSDVEMSRALEILQTYLTEQSS